MSARTHLVAVILALGLVSCASIPQARTVGGEALSALVSDRLYFGRAMPDGRVVSEEEWRAFLGSVVTPRFPAGLTVWRAEGQWRGDSGEIVREETFVLELVHSGDAGAEESIAAIIASYRERFAQESVMRVRSSVLVGF